MKNKNWIMIIVIGISFVSFQNKGVCRVQNLAGDQPEGICQMREFLKAYSQQAYPYPGKNAMIIFGSWGTGKTKTAEAIANEANVILMYYDVGELRIDEGPWLLFKIKDIYDKAEQVSKAQKKPVVIVFDYVDNISKSNIDELLPGQRAALIELCNQIKRHSYYPYMVTILVTARTETINDELKQTCIPIFMPMPSRKNRQEIVKFYAKKYSLDLSDEQINKYAHYSDFSGRDIENSFARAKVYAMGRTKNRKITEPLLERAFEQFRQGNDVNKSWFTLFWRNLNEAMGTT